MAKNKVEEVMGCFGEYDCSQAILSAWCEEYGLDKETALKLSCGFAGGMARLGHTCGAVTGAYLVISLKYGKCQPGDVKAKEKTFELIQEFDKRFIEKNDTTNCRELLGVDLRYGDIQYAKEQVQKKCSGLVRDAAEILEAIL
ncbi:C-GCAxxG-C-C family protein [Anaerosporobacter sp.]|uniref:C-GCAxxG-C-C family protein n=1 Tax=Anaerosporobacter sp. TaxID=1872529 RepID=UPI00286F4427|nr:C-GCAxxG-C-C family protein [Anaerosporobacter sp.]